MALAKTCAFLGQYAMNRHEAMELHIVKELHVFNQYELSLGCFDAHNRKIFILSYQSCACG
ncbi:hypothetical protein SAMN02745220_04618 [Desulfopila aestuarii DSM 18488]|uniref:Uncharacterized protein n=1 Tax=Desulfopila aestuarii DSM 18488 TaxID=1121416 RepID=A0A1M7YJ00_9BACT|nr:hypothetical protein SAMN02745220_04618 [Desulfopila aestuarii DSM 18488]